MADDLSDDRYFFRDDEGWHFWDETWAFSKGPFRDRALAEQGLRDYCEYLDGRPEAWQENCKARSLASKI